MRFLFARQMWSDLEDRIRGNEEREKIVTFLKSSAFARDDPYVASLINSLKAGGPVIFTLLQCILLLTTERGRLIKELIELSERRPPSMIVLKDRDKRAFKDGRPWPQPVPEPPDVLFYKPGEEDK